MVGDTDILKVTRGSGEVVHMQQIIVGGGDCSKGVQALGVSDACPQAAPLVLVSVAIVSLPWHMLASPQGCPQSFMVQLWSMTSGLSSWLLLRFSLGYGDLLPGR